MKPKYFLLFFLIAGSYIQAIEVTIADEHAESLSPKEKIATMVKIKSRTDLDHTPENPKECLKAKLKKGIEPEIKKRKNSQ